MKRLLINIFGLIAIIGVACKKTFLDAKPSTDLLVPTALADLQRLLDNTDLLNFTAALGQMGSDEYVFYDLATWQSTGTATERNSYIWAKDIYEGEVTRRDWNDPYKSIFYANSVLAGLANSAYEKSAKARELRGWALFIRAYSFYDLMRTFAKTYDSGTANSDLGVPLRLSGNIDEILPRSTIEECYSQIIGDLKQSCRLLPSAFQRSNRNRPSQGTAYALMSRVYLSMNKYNEAELYADSSLNIYSTLIDYKTISQTSATPFSIYNEETLFSSSQISTYSITTNTVNNPTIINPELISLYAKNDLRLNVFFNKNVKGDYYSKRGYYGSGNYPFTGLATDELYLVKAECLARRGEIVQAMSKLDELLIKRWNSTATNPAVPYMPMQANDKADAIRKVLTERRKELVWRGLRWSDLKRLALIGEGVVLKRTLNGQEFVLQPNDPKYVLPIPDDEITRSGIEQNVR